MLKLKLQYFGHLMRTVDSLEKTLMLGGIGALTPGAPPQRARPSPTGLPSKRGPGLLPPIPPSIRVFSNESTLPMRWPKYWSFSFSIIPSKEIKN